MFNLFKKKEIAAYDTYHKKVGVEICFKDGNLEQRSHFNFNYSHSKEETAKLQEQCQEEIATLYRKLNAGTSEFFKPTDDLCIKKCSLVFAAVFIEDVQD